MLIYTIHKKTMLTVSFKNGKLMKNLFKHAHSYTYKNFSERVKLDPYLILEVNRSADWKTIKTAYFKLARLYHPDLNKNDEVCKIRYKENILLLLFISIILNSEST